MAEEPLAQHGSLRLFVAVLLPPDWREYLAATARVLERQAPGYARWVEPRSLHLTLVFLGYQPAEQLETVVAAIRSAAEDAHPFQLGLGHPGVFGPPGKPRVIFNHVADLSGALQPLHRALTESLAARGIAFDPGSLRPHITLGRARRDASVDSAARLRLALAKPAPGRSALGILPVRAISLMQSHLSPKGAQYVELASCRLGAAT
jgi:2'-5' RNA ligase